MSIQAVAWVLEAETTTKGAERLVLLSIANHANESWQCWPSIGTIAAEANVSFDHAKTVLRRLETAGVIRKEVNAAPDSRMRSDRRPNLYTILRDGGAQNHLPSADGGVIGQPTGGQSVTERGGAECPPNRKEPSEEPKTNPGLLIDVLDPARLEAEASLEESFEAFWQAYPRKTAKADARKKWAKAVKAAEKQHPHYSPGVIIDAARRYAEDPNRVDQFTAHASTWLNQERWDDPPLPSRTGADRATERDAANLAAARQALDTRKQIGR